MNTSQLLMGCTTKIKNTHVIVNSLIFYIISLHLPQQRFASCLVLIKNTIQDSQHCSTVLGVCISECY